jgi:proteasome lid subunit RPN8/RPN11
MWMLGAVSAAGIDVHQTFAKTSSSLKARVKIAVLLPTRLPGTFQGEKIFPIVDRATASGYAIDIALSPDCAGEHACSPGNVYGSAKPFKDPEIVPPGGTRVRLSSRIVAIYRASSGGSPYPSNADLSWKQNGAYYAIALNTGSLAELLLTARSMR